MNKIPKFLSFFILSLLPFAISAQGQLNSKKLEAANDSLLVVIEKMKSEMSDLVIEIQDYRHHLQVMDSLMEEKEHRIAELEANNEYLQNKVNQSQGTNASSNAAMETLKKRNSDMEYYLVQYQEKISQLNAKVDSLQKLTQPIRH